MSSQIDTNGAFAEAAYGPDGPQGLSGVTGGGVVHEAAWKQALVQAKSMFRNETESQGQAGTLPSLLTSSDEPLGSPSETDVRAAHPLSWDRLSMTVASMVAWNMSVELADDVAAPPLVHDPMPMDVEADAADPPTIPEPLLTATDGAATAGSKVLQSSLDGRKLGSAASDLMTMNGGNAGLDEATLYPGDETIAVSDSGSLTPNEPTYREDAQDLNAQVVMRGDATGLIDAEPQVANTNQPGAASSDGSPPIMMNVTNAGMPEIPSSSKSVGPAAYVGSPQEGPQRVESPVGDSSKVLESILRVRSSSALPLEAQMGQQRLEGIRTVLADLEAQAALRNTVADLIRAPRPETIRPESLTGFVGAGGVADRAVGKQGAATVQSTTLDHTGHKAAPGSTDADANQTYGRTPSGEFDSASGAEESLRANRPRPTVAKRPVAETGLNAAGPAPTATTASFEAVVGVENSEIATDQDALVEILEVDGATIEADEVPELAVQDISHLDIDIDDPMGAVRMAMTREAEEVSIRMETPAEVLEQYREMEEEMAEALASQGLDLSNFSADAQGFGENAEESSRGDAARTSSDPEMSQAVGDEKLKQSGTVSRLVNRIV